MPASPAEAGVTVAALLDHLGVPATGKHVDWTGTLEGPVPLNTTAGMASVAFCDRDGSEAATKVRESSATVVLMRQSMLQHFEDGLPGRVLVGCKSPRLAFIEILDRFWPETPAAERVGGGGLVHPSAVVASSAYVDAGATIGPACVIGAGSTIHCGARLYRGTRVGRDVRIDANAVIGSPGFGFERESDGSWRRFPQRAAVVIEDDVEIGAGVCIDRGALTDTLIGQGTKIDNLAYIAHNVVVGRNCLIMASSVIAGSCRIGDEAVVSPAANIREGRVIGPHAHVGLGAVVVSDVAARTVVVGVPAKFLRAGTYEG